MAIVFVLIPISLVLVGIACWAFFWAVGSGQFDELEAPAWEILTDDDDDDDDDDSGAVPRAHSE